ncbi:MAG TPA: nicotinate-nucleotide adenylyltransferase [Gemmatimonadales bacterium]|nr:nicotinate-nucleotide adenylyltransferase [Gemmatimonadales bacterium]
MPSIGLFGGSFDPIHHGHLIVARVALEALGLDQLRFLPAREQPFKRGRHVAPAGDRAVMLELAIAGSPGFAVERAELDRPGPSYTVDTLEAVQAREPDAQLTLLLGADAAAELSAWHRADQLPRLARIVVFGRPGTPVPTSPLVARSIEVPAVDISATEIRRRAQAGLPVRYWVPDAVAEYMVRHRLYLDPE